MENAIIPYCYSYVIIIAGCPVTFHLWAHFRMQNHYTTDKRQPGISIKCYARNNDQTYLPIMHIWWIQA